MSKIALAQINPVVGAIAKNAAKIEDFIAQARRVDAEIVVFPELALTGYPPEDLLLKPHFIEKNLKALQGLIPATTGLTAVIGFVDRDSQGRTFNAAAVLQDGTFAGVYHKQDLPNYGVFDEKRYFSKGNTNPVFSAGTSDFCVSICEDIWSDDKGICLKQKDAGAELLINISSSPFELNKFQLRKDLVQKRAQEAGMPVVYVNLVGGQDELVFDGGSMIADGQGRLLAVAERFQEQLLVVDLSADGGCEVITGTDVVSQESMSRPQEAYQALVTGTRDYIQKNGFGKVVIGLSGGIDSALVAAVAVAAIGKDNVVGVSMPSKYNSEGTRSDARRLAANLGIVFKEISIEAVFKNYTDVLVPHFDKKPADSTEENIQARIRGNFLMALSNKFGWLVLTTGNKSELAVGYCTLYGDMSGGFAVIKDVPKTLVYDLCRYINSLEEVIPTSIIDRPPSAELRENQKDQDSLPPYEDLDDIVLRYVEDHQSLEAIAKCHPEDMVKRVIHLIDLNEYKRRQAPPGVKITTRAFGKDWRLPITNCYKD